jgi:predicted phage terminase large subunit-like protein
VGLAEIHDYNAMVVIGQDMNAGFVYILETTRGRYTFLERKAFVIKKYDEWKKKTNFFGNVSIEALGFQNDLCNEILRERPDIPIRRDVPRVDKITRLTPVAALAENGKLIPGHGQEDLMDELILFPGFDHDDLADALEKAIQGLRNHVKITRKPQGM